MSYQVGKYQACKTCGSTKVVRKTVAAADPTKEIVIITCSNCDGRRARYQRKKRK